MATRFQKQTFHRDAAAMSYQTVRAAKKQADIAVFDFSEVFYKVSLTHLANKLYYYGIRVSTLVWIHFLSNRTQQVVLDGVASRTVKVTSCVPHGSVIGPILFFIYINDLPKSLASKVRLFADAAIVYKERNSAEDYQILQNDLDKLTSWEDLWLIHFTPSKCEALAITHKRLPIMLLYSIIPCMN